MNGDGRKMFGIREKFRNYATPIVIWVNKNVLRLNFDEEA